MPKRAQSESRRLTERFIFRLDDYDRERLDELATRLGVSRAEAIKQGLQLLELSTRPRTTPRPTPRTTDAKH